MKKKFRIKRVYQIVIDTITDTEESIAEYPTRREAEEAASMLEDMDNKAQNAYLTKHDLGG